MSEIITYAMRKMKEYIEGSDEFDKSTEEFLDSVIEFICYANLLVSNRQETTGLYNQTINFFISYVYPNREKFAKKTLYDMSKCINLMYMWFNNHAITRQDSTLDDLSVLFINILRFYRVVFESSTSKNDDNDHEIRGYYLKKMTEFLMFTSNDVISTKHQQIYQEVSKDTINYL